MRTPSVSTILIRSISSVGLRAPVFQTGRHGFPSRMLHHFSAHVGEQQSQRSVKAPPLGASLVRVQLCRPFSLARSSKVEQSADNRSTTARYRPSQPICCRMEQRSARQPHKLKVPGSSPGPAPNFYTDDAVERTSLQNSERGCNSFRPCQWERSSIDVERLPEEQEVAGASLGRSHHFHCRDKPRDAEEAHTLWGNPMAGLTPAPASNFGPSPSSYGARFGSEISGVRVPPGRPISRPRNNSMFASLSKRKKWGQHPSVAPLLGMEMKESNQPPVTGKSAGASPVVPAISRLRQAAKAPGLHPGIPGVRVPQPRPLSDGLPAARCAHGWRPHEVDGGPALQSASTFIFPSSSVT